MFNKKILTKIGVIAMIPVMFVSMTAFGKKDEETTVDETPEGLCNSATFLYPEKGDSFRLNVYDNHVEITQVLTTRSSISIPDKIDNLPVLKICNSAFQDCVTITSVSIPDSVYSIGNNAFKGCSNLESVKLGSGITNVGTDTFSGTALKSIEIPNNITYIPDGFCENCSELSYVIIDEPSVTGTDENGATTYSASATLEDNCFASCSSLKYVWIPAASSFGEDHDSNPFNKSTDNLNIYSYAQSDAAAYASNMFVDFTLVNSASQLTEFKQIASTASETNSILAGDDFEGEQIEVSIENVYVVKNALPYSVSYTVDNKEIVTKDYTYEPVNDTVVVIVGLEIKNKGSKPISLNPLNGDIYVDSYVNRFADFGTLSMTNTSKYAAPSYTEIQAGETDYIYLASIVPTDWSEIKISIGDFDELSNAEFVIKATDSNVIYIGSAESAIEEPATSVSEASSEADGETTSAGEVSAETETAVTDEAGESTTVPVT